MKSVVSKKALKRAAKIFEQKIETVIIPTPLPVVTFQYPQHGNGGPTTRFVRVMKMDDDYLMGLEIQHEFDAEPGSPKTYLIEKIRGGGDVRLLHLAPAME